jgi:DNA-binding HxlR family transcriptional regulator
MQRGSTGTANEAALGPVGEHCEVGEVLAMLGQPHMLRILHEVLRAGGRPLRFGELQDRLRLSPKTLSVRLRTLVERGFLTRRSFHEIPPRVDYETTAKTSEFRELFALLDAWAHRNSMRAVPVVSVVGRLPSPRSRR